MKNCVQTVIMVVILVLMVVVFAYSNSINGEYYFIDNSTKTVYDGENVRFVRHYRGGNITLFLNDDTVVELDNYIEIKKENYIESTKEEYYLSICTAINESQLIDENDNIWVADRELIPESRYSVMFTDNSTKEIEDDLIVEFKLICK